MYISNMYVICIYIYISNIHIQIRYIYILSIDQQIHNPQYIHIQQYAQQNIRYDIAYNEDKKVAK